MEPNFFTRIPFERAALQRGANPKRKAVFGGVVIREGDKITEPNFGFFKAAENKASLKLNVDLPVGDQ